MFKTVSFSQSLLVEYIQEYQNTKNGTAQERGKKHGAQAAFFLGTVWRQGLGLPSWVCGFGQLYTCCREPGVRTLPATLPSVSTPVSDSFSSQSKPY